MNPTFKKLAVFSLILTLGLSPALSYAKNDGPSNKGRGKDQGKKEFVHAELKEKRPGKKEDKYDKGSRRCFKAFGHLIAPGFIKNFGEVSFPMDCFLPFGIAKKFRGLMNPTSTPDVIAPVIRSLRVETRANSAEVRWETNERANSTVFWSTSPDLDTDSTSTASTTQSALVRDHRVTLENLTASTTYYIVVRSKDASGNSAFSSEMSFKTKTLPADTNAPVISSVATLAGTSTISIHWDTNEEATSRVYYGTSSNLDTNATSTNFVENSTLKTDHQITLSNLATSTTYFMVVESRDASNNKTQTPIFSSTTQGN